MRDPTRIDIILTRLSNLWHKYPDLRLGQLISNVLDPNRQPFIEDAELMDRLETFYSTLENSEK